LDVKERMIDFGNRILRAPRLDVALCEEVEADILALENETEGLLKEISR
jgi:hypothetical protein